MGPSRVLKGSHETLAKGGKVANRGLDSITHGTLKECYNGLLLRKATEGGNNHGRFLS